jgi:hypothetical protein
MKLHPLAILLFLIVPRPTAARLLSPSSPHSVCNRKKTSLSGWLPLPSAHQNAQQPFLAGSFPSRRPSFPLTSLPSLVYSNSK